MQNENILITGNSGKTGRRVEAKLQQMGLATRGVSRSTTRPFDWNNEKSWGNALTGVTSAYVAYQPDLAVPGATDCIERFTNAARTAGVKHIVLLSGRGEVGAQRAEQIICNSGLDWNIVRASWFAQNFCEGFLLENILQGEVVLPQSTVLEPFIDIDDIADVVVASLTDNNLNNQLFEVTGPKLMTFADCIDCISAATGRKITLTTVTIDEYINHLQSRQLPSDILWLMRELFTEVLDGRNSTVSDGIFQALGRAPGDFTNYAIKTQASGVWEVDRMASNY